MSRPFLSFIEIIFAWNVPSVSLIFLKRSLVFPILLLSSISLRWLLRKALSLLLLFGTLHSNEYIFPFLLCIFSFLSYISVAFKCVRTLGSLWIHSAILSSFFLKMYPKWSAKLLSKVALVCRNISTITHGDLSFWLTLILNILLRCWRVAVNLDINLGRTEIWVFAFLYSILI